MTDVSVSGARAVGDIAERHGFSVEAARAMLDAVVAGNGSMAQFDHREFAGAGQWMRGGMTMVADMFNNDLKGRIDALCTDLAKLVAQDPGARAASMQRSGDWWPGGLGHPNSVGSQGGMRYAYFARARRLAIERASVVTLYDTQDHQISGVSQQQGLSGSLRFSSQHGPVDVTSLPVVPG